MTRAALLEHWLEQLKCGKIEIVNLW